MHAVVEQHVAGLDDVRDRSLGFVKPLALEHIVDGRQRLGPVLHRLGEPLGLSFRENPSGLSAGFCQLLFLNYRGVDPEGIGSIPLSLEIRDCGLVRGSNDAIEFFGRHRPAAHGGHHSV